MYRAEQVREFDRCAIEEHGIPGAVLMERAGTAAYRMLRKRWPQARDITVLCGVGNNGGDGYVVALLARQEGLVTRVLQLGDPEKLHGDALTMLQRYRQAGGELLPFQGLPRKTHVIVDAVLGTGLEREVTGDWAAALEAVNRHRAAVLAIDIPSGLHSDTGRILGTAVRAQATISFIGLKQGMFTGQGPDCCGEVEFSGLEVPATIYSREILASRRLDWRKQSDLLEPRPRSAHKGNFGHVLVLGGASGYTGAARMAAEAALRCGAGLVSLATHPEHAALMNLTRPELMCHGVAEACALDPLLERATAVAVGPGLGRSDWARELLSKVLASNLPLVVDADALNLLAGQGTRRDNWVLTPHPGEAGRLLGVTTADIEADRFTAAHNLWVAYGGTIVLKGAGTLICNGSRTPPAVCSDGNPGMASGGMGDLLTGLIAAFIAQKFEPEEAACMGVCLHAAAGDAAATDSGERGLLASDLLPWFRPLLNPEAGGC
jgi:NAD(P)H-hydrate epimerase